MSVCVQPLLDNIYTLGRYDQRIDYTRPLTPAPSDDDVAWVQQQLKNRALGPTGDRSE
jgi:hypothetical protein